jgi:tumor protein p53-inducible protein 3
MNNLMRAVGYTPPGLIENLFIGSRPLPVLKANECLVKVYFSALNRADTLQRRGLYPPPPGESDILGLEAVGVVDRCHSAESKWRKNDRVMALCGGGGNAEYVAVHESNLIRIPEWMSFKQAAAVPEVWLTAFQLLYWVSNVTKAESAGKNVSDLRVLVHAGASGVGTSLIQMLTKVLKVTQVFATVGSEKKREYLEKELQVSKAFNYKLEEEKNFDKHIMSMTQNLGVDLVFDCVGGSYWERNTNCMAMDAEWIIYGLMGGTGVNGDLLGRVLRKRIQIKGSTLRSRTIQVIMVLIFFWLCLHFSYLICIYSTNMN